MTPPRALEAGPLAGANSASTEYTERGHTVRGPGFTDSRSIPRGRGKSMGFSFLSKRPARIRLVQAFCLCFCIKSTANTSSSCKSAAQHRFLVFLLIFFLRHAHLGNVMLESHWWRTPRWQMLHVGAVMELSCMAWHQSPSWCAWLDWSPQQARNPNSFCCMI